MATELALHAYLFLGNALNTLLNGLQVDYAAELGATEAELRALYAGIEPMTPNNILDAIAALPPRARLVLARIARWCIDRLGPQLEQRIGVQPEEAASVLAFLDHLPRQP